MALVLKGELFLVVIEKKENQRILKEARDGAEKTPGFTKTSSPQRKLQNSRRTGQYIGNKNGTDIT